MPNVENMERDELVKMLADEVAKRKRLEGACKYSIERLNGIMIDDFDRGRILVEKKDAWTARAILDRLKDVSEGE